MDLNELAGRVEALAGPDRLIDATISAALRLEAMPMWAKTWAGEWRPEADGRVTLMQADGAEGPNFLARAYTASIDAAMMLVATERDWMLDTFDGKFTGHRCSASVWVSKERWIDASGATPALALTAAALRCKALGAVHTVGEG